MNKTCIVCEKETLHSESKMLIATKTYGDDVMDMCPSCAHKVLSIMVILNSENLLKAIKLVKIKLH